MLVATQHRDLRRPDDGCERPQLILVVVSAAKLSSVVSWSVVELPAGQLPLTSAKGSVRYSCSEVLYAVRRMEWAREACRAGLQTIFHHLGRIASDSFPSSALLLLHRSADRGRRCSMFWSAAGPPKAGRDEPGQGWMNRNTAGRPHAAPLRAPDPGRFAADRLAPLYPRSG
jgi:hypothetical protein